MSASLEDAALRSAKMIETLAARCHDLERRLNLRNKEVVRARQARDLWKARALRYRERTRA